MRIVRCSHCGCIYTDNSDAFNYNQPSVDLKNRLETYQKYYWPRRRASAARFWKSAQAYCQTGMLLDVGCGFGFFVREAQHQSWSAIGVEIADDQRQWGIKELNLDIVSGLDCDRLNRYRFDVITLWDVIEHISHTQNLLQKCAQLLRPGGLLFIKTPNADALLLKKTWSSWPLLELYWQLVYPANPKEHIYHFTPGFLITVLNQNNYQIRQVDTWQDWDERVVVGRDLITSLLRRVLMFIVWKIKLPYEMTIWAENDSKNVFGGYPGY